MKIAEFKSKNPETVLRKATLCFLLREGEVLLAMKKRGFGEGKWNGVGGKVMEGESIEEAMKRECQEEIGVALKELEEVGRIKFYFDGREDWNQEVVVFVSREWEGEISESEEMKPMWYKQDKVPYEIMWSDDSYWLPKVLEGKKIEGEFLFNDDNVFDDWIVKEIE